MISFTEFSIKACAVGFCKAILIYTLVQETENYRFNTTPDFYRFAIYKVIRCKLWGNFLRRRFHDGYSSPTNQLLDQSRISIMAISGYI